MDFRPKKTLKGAWIPKIWLKIWGLVQSEPPKVLGNRGKLQPEKLHQTLWRISPVSWRAERFYPPLLCIRHQASVWISAVTHKSARLSVTGDTKVLLSWEVSRLASPSEWRENVLICMNRSAPYMGAVLDTTPPSWLTDTSRVLKQFSDD